MSSGRRRPPVLGHGHRQIRLGVVQGLPCTAPDSDNQQSALVEFYCGWYSCSASGNGSRQPSNSELSDITPVQGDDRLNGSIRTPMDQRTNAAVRRFGSFELDLDAERLMKNGREVRIQPQPFRLLCLLTNRPGLLVTREEIQAALWAGDTFVDFDQGVNFAVKQVRDALGDSAEDSLYVQTVPKRGYRFLAPVETGPEPMEPARVGSVDPPPESTLGEHRRASPG